jgi:16S rRNA (guanine(966)-N(2))-methyltransferase RsmD
VALTGHIRLASGSLRGRRIPIPRGVRPTASRVREALLDIWSQKLTGARFLDLFAGSGAVGLEALSRGARFAAFAEGDRRVCAALEAICRELAPHQTRVVLVDLVADCERFRRTFSRGFELIFADPPYDFDGHVRVIQSLERLTVSGGEIAIEHGRTVALPEELPGVHRHDHRVYGDSALSFYRFDR